MDDIESKAQKIAPEDWGKALIEEILFRAARDVSQRANAAVPLTVTMVFDVTADQPSRTIKISTVGAVEPIIATQVKL